jgi:glyceraldehyde 3-phosphate dehydrogenase
MAITKEIVALQDLKQARLDIGTLAIQWNQSKSQYNSLTSFVSEKLNSADGAQSEDIQPRDVILYGFGRIGRLVARRLVAQTGRGEQLRLKAIVIRVAQMKDRKQDAEKGRLYYVPILFMVNLPAL